MLRFTGRILLGFVLFIVCYALVIFTLSRIPVAAETTAEVGTIPVYIKTNGVHSDLVVPYRNELKDWSSLVRPNDTFSENHNAKFISVGWGDRDFYLYTPTWADLKVSTALKATLYLGKSVMHAELLDAPKTTGNWRKLLLTGKQYLRLSAYIEESFNKGQDGKSVPIPNVAYGDYDAFYEATGSYSGAYTCNSWVNEGLKAGGQKAALWTLTDTGIFCHYE